VERETKRADERQASEGDYGEEHGGDVVREGAEGAMARILPMGVPLVAMAKGEEP